MVDDTGTIILVAVFVVIGLIIGMGKGSGE